MGRHGIHVHVSVWGVGYALWQNRLKKGKAGKVKYRREKPRHHMRLQVLQPGSAGPGWPRNSASLPLLEPCPGLQPLDHK